MIFVLNVNKITTECSLFQKFSFFSSISGTQRAEVYFILEAFAPLEHRFKKKIRKVYQKYNPVFCKTTSGIKVLFRNFPFISNERKKINLKNSGK